MQPGKCADLIAVDLSDLGVRPVYNVSSALVYAAASKHLVRHVWVNGQHVVANGELRTLDTAEISRNADAWAERIQADTTDA